MRAPDEAQTISPRRCVACALVFFAPTWRALPAFYAALARTPDYYEADKWEFRVALNALAGAGRVVEFGSGAGHFLGLFRARYPAARVDGVDWQPAAVAGVYADVAALRAAAPGPRDAVCAFQFLEHLEEPRAFFAECADLLAPGGRLLVSVPDDGGFVPTTTNNVFNFPPHHATRWREETFRHIPGFAFVRTWHEPLSAVHAHWFAANRLYRRVLTAFRMRWRPLETDPLKLLILKACWFFARWTGTLSGNGHTLLVELRKS